MSLSTSEALHEALGSLVCSVDVHHGCSYPARSQNTPITPVHGNGHSEELGLGIGPAEIFLASSDRRRRCGHNETTVTIPCCAHLVAAVPHAA